VPGTCTLCGETRVEREAAFGGAYTGACRECREDYDAPPRHVDTCEREACPVCADHKREFGGDA